MPESLATNRPNTAFHRRDDLRVKLHLWRALRKTQRAGTTHLTPRQRQRRQAHLDHLAAYIKTGRFPRNTTSRARQPVFLDEFGIHCAMGHLLALDGHHDVVRDVQRLDNNVRVMDLRDARFDAWLEENGLTHEEAAMIQPTYGGMPPASPVEPLPPPPPPETGDGSLTAIWLVASVLGLVCMVAVNHVCFAASRFRRENPVAAHAAWSGATVVIWLLFAVAMVTL